MNQVDAGISKSISTNNTRKDSSLREIIVLGILSVIAMTTCCVLPLLLVSLGVTGVFIGQMSSLYQYHWYFLAFASAALLYGFWKAYRPISEQQCADGSCAKPMNRTVIRSIVWVALAIVLGALAFQYIAPSLLSPF